MANACARVAVARFLEKACCHSVLDPSFVYKVVVDMFLFFKRVFFFACLTRKFRQIRAV